jgi:hypothetical protein
VLRQFIQWRNETSNKPEHLARSYYFLRKSVGVIGIATPFVLVIGTMILGNSFVIKDSISSYYYTVTGNIFVGSMCASAIFLICYRPFSLSAIVMSIWMTLLALLQVPSRLA